MKRLGHVNFPFEAWVHRQKGCPVQFLESGHEHDVDVLYVEYVEVTNVKFCLAAVSENLPANSLIELLVLRKVVLELRAWVSVLGQQTRLAPTWEFASRKLY
jgi:hypothetical protein